MVSEEDNEKLLAEPTLEEVKHVVFSFNGYSTYGPDGFSGLFYQQCWVIVGKDALQLVRSFCEGNKYYSHKLGFNP